MKIQKLKKTLKHLIVILILFLVFAFAFHYINKKSFPKHKWKKADYIGTWIPVCKTAEGNITISDDFEITFKYFPKIYCKINEFYNKKYIIFKCNIEKSKQTLYVRLNLFYRGRLEIPKVNLEIYTHEKKSCLKHRDFYKENGEVHSMESWEHDLCRYELQKTEIYYSSFRYRSFCYGR